MLGRAIATTTDTEPRGNRDVIRAARRGDADAWRFIFDEHHGRLYRFFRSRVATHEEAEDLTSDVFLEAHRSIGSLRWRRRPIGAWLFGIARRRLASHYRARRPASAAPADGVELEHVRDEYVSIEVRDLLARLRPEHRIALELRWVVGLSGEEAAAAMGKSHGAFRTLLYRAGLEFRRLSDMDGDPGEGGT